MAELRVRSFSFSNGNTLIIMDTKLILMLTNAVCKNMCTTQTLVDHLREVTPIVSSLTPGQINDLELSCIKIWKEYIEDHKGETTLRNAVGELVKAINEQGKAVITTSLYDSSFSTTRLIRGGKDIYWVPPKIQ